MGKLRVGEGSINLIKQIHKIPYILLHDGSTPLSRLLENGFGEMPLFQKALREVVATIDTEYAKQNEDFWIGLEGSFGAKHVTPRTLMSHFLGNTVCVEGIVTKSVWEISTDYKVVCTALSSCTQMHT